MATAKLRIAENFLVQALFHTNNSRVGIRNITLDPKDSELFIFELEGPDIPKAKFVQAVVHKEIIKVIFKPADEL